MLLNMVSSWLKSAYAKLLIIISLLLLGSSLGFYFLELRPSGEDNPFSALYWAVVTLTTVGYGDYAPVTLAGRVLGILVMLSGIGLVSTLSGNLASLLVDRRVRKRKGLLHVKLHGHIMVLGWNVSAIKLVETLLQAKGLDNRELVLVNELPADDRDELACKLELGDRLHFVFGNPANKNVLLRASPDSANLVYILGDSNMDPKEADQQAINTALTLRNLAPKAIVYGEAML
ncbi:MAG: potassium channel protein, partial [Desulfovibrio sp.]